jgi:two-component system phosphorelay protein LuxU
MDNLLLNREKIAQLSSEIGVENVPMLLDIFTGELRDYIAQLQHNDAQTCEKLSEISHALKSSAASFGADALCQRANSVDARVKRSEILTFESDVQPFVTLLDATLDAYLAFSVD